MRAFAITLVSTLLSGGLLSGVVLSGTAGCGGKRQVGPGGPQAALVFPAARWVPATPTYLFASRSLRDAQKSFGDGIDTVGLLFGGSGRESVSMVLTTFLQVDALNADAMAGIGVDVDGSMALFSAEIDPTLVLHLSAPAQLQAFIAKQRERGMTTQSVMVEGVEVLTAKVDSEINISWAVETEWLWIHLAFAPHGDTSDWFGASRHAGAATWGAKWDAAEKLAKKPSGLTGVFDLRAFTSKIATRVPQFATCARQFEAVEGVGVAFEAEAPWVSATLAVDVGGSAQPIASNTIAPPPGWSTASAKAPLSAQWNLDMRTAAAWLQPCMHGGPDLVGMLDGFGVRTARGFVYKLDPDDKSGVGVIAFDLSSRRFFEDQLSQIPLRSKFEKSRQFGAYKGKHLSVPLVATADYVLDDRVFIAAMGDGQLERAATPSGTAAPPPVFAVDVVPAGLPVDVWTWLFTEAEINSPARLAERLQSWADLHLTAALSGSRLVIQAQGNRR